jgi:hypothetical protein
MVSQQLLAARAAWIHAHLLVAPTDPQTLCLRAAHFSDSHIIHAELFLGTSDRQLEICQQDSGMAIGAFASDLS